MSDLTDEEFDDLRSDIHHFLKIDHPHPPSDPCGTCRRRADGLARVVERWINFRNEEVR